MTSDSSVDILRSSAGEPETLASLLMSRLEREVLTAESRRMISRCSTSSQFLHQGQRRADGRPYIIHPFRVALLSAEYSRVAELPDAVCIALLHDVIEDSRATHNDVQAMA